MYTLNVLNNSNIVNFTSFEDIVVLYFLLVLILLIALFVAYLCGNAPNAWLGALTLLIIYYCLYQQLQILQLMQYPNFSVELIKEGENLQCYVLHCELKQLFGSIHIEDLHNKIIKLLIIGNTLYIPTKTFVTLNVGPIVLVAQTIWAENAGIVVSNIPGFNIVAVDISSWTLIEQPLLMETTIIKETLWTYLDEIILTGFTMLYTYEIIGLFKLSRDSVAWTVLFTNFRYDVLWGLSYWSITRLAASNLTLIVVRSILDS